ncbi:PLP-dependent aminotransferase family protein [Sphaerotilus mobilis]|uniref:GntR family transcriptional regulator n=1 Tax=Sphaerotilus mobilis TaxID=47994 RepID=A0A4Q7LIW6_9BURK|nr:PLP-dependent aminotransferase family protein [Sphaerotilus mobilis]RZS53369.1 GntR family transcriptional regulator [Sphaerotilus mobilis]
MDQLPSSDDLGAAPARPGRRIYLLLRAQMTDGTLAAGARVPSTRALAAEFGVSRTTVTAAYEQLAAEGFITTALGRVARVTAPLASTRAPVDAPRPRTERRARATRHLSDFAQRISAAPMPVMPAEGLAPVDFRYGALAASDFPILAWRRQYLLALQRPADSLYYAAPEGLADLRRAIQGYLRRARGVVCDAEQVLVVHGSQQAIDLCARLLLNPSDAFVFEDPGYLMARRSFEATGAQRWPAPVDEHGLVTDALPRDARVRLAYVTPSHQFPLGGVLPFGRRQQLLQWAQRQEAWVIEDDYDGEFRYGQRPIDALQALDADGRVIYVGTFSKALSPQMRLGYLVLPPELVPVFRQAKRLTDRHAPVMEQRVLAALMDDGTYERHVRRLRRENERRRSALLEAVARHMPADTQVVGTSAGLHAVLWLTGLQAREEGAVIAAALEAGVSVYPLSPLYASPPPDGSNRPAGLVLGYASLTVEAIEAGIQGLGAALHRWTAARHRL